MAEFKLRIDGMHCGSCVGRVTEALKSAQGVEIKEVLIGSARLDATVQPSPIDLVIATLARAGYTAHLEP